MDGASSTVEVLLDAYQFARHNQFIVDLAPLQLYASALVFAPDSSTIKTLFKPHMPSWLLTPPKIEGTWRSDVLKFEGHTLAIRAVAFSPDDKLLGTCSRDGTTRIWDTIDASCSLMVSYDEHKHFPGAIAFSSDSSKFAVAYSEANLPVNLAVIIHSARTGTSLRTMQCPGLWSSVLRPAIAFEDDEIVLVAADEDRVQILRSVNDSNNFIRHWTPHFPNHDILYGAHVCISQNASLIYYSAFLGYKSVSISVLDPKTRVVLSRRDLEEDICHISGMANDCGAAAPVYKVSDFETQSSNVWSLDVEHQDKSTHLFDCASSIWDGFSLANARDKVAYIMRGDFTVHVEAIPKRKMVGERRDASLGRKVAVAPRGNLVADWDDGSLTVINTKGLVVTRTVGPDFDFDDTIYEPKSLMISPDCQYIALGQDEGTTVWNIEIGKSSEYNMIKRARVLAFSDDNQLMATHQWEFDSLRVWDLDSRQQLMLETDQTNLPDFRRLKFSANGKDLITEHGRLHIATATWTMSESTDPSSFGKDVGLSSMPGIRRSDWVQFDDEDLLWIPDVYRAVLDSYDARGGTVALGQEDGSLLIMKISDPW
jgi:WD40 repeat protein